MHHDRMKMFDSLPASVVERLLTLLDAKFIVRLPILFRLPLCNLNHHVLRNAAQRLSLQLDDKVLSAKEFSKINSWFLTIECLPALNYSAFIGFSVELEDCSIDQLQEFRISKLIRSVMVSGNLSDFAMSSDSFTKVFVNSSSMQLHCFLESNESNLVTKKYRKAKIMPRRTDHIFENIGEQLPDLLVLEVFFRESIEDSFYQAFAGLPHLQRLEMKSVYDRLPSSLLETLRLSCPAINHVSLHFLSLQFSDMRDFLLQTPSLEVFDCQHIYYKKGNTLAFSNYVTDPDSGISGYSSDGLKELLQEITDLKTVRLRLPKMDEPNECLFAVATNNPDLQTLHLGCVTADYDLGVGAVIARCARLEKLIFSDCKDHGVVAVLFLLVRYLHLATVSEAFLDAQHGLDIHIRTCNVDSVRALDRASLLEGVVLGVSDVECISANSTLPVIQEAAPHAIIALIEAVAQLDCCKSMEQAALPKYRRFSTWRAVIARSSWSYKTLRIFRSPAGLEKHLKQGALDGLREFEISSKQGGVLYSIDRFALEVARRSPNLTRLSLNKSHRGYLTDSELMEMADKAPHLQYLALGHCDKLTVASIEYVLQRCTSLAVLEIPKSIVASAHVDRLETLFQSRLVFVK